jgi:hypothetical protein
MLYQQVLEPVVSIFVYPFQKGWAKSTHTWARVRGAVEASCRGRFDEKLTKPEQVLAVQESPAVKEVGGEVADIAKDTTEDVKEWLEELLNNKDLYEFLVSPVIDGDKKKMER